MKWIKVDDGSGELNIPDAERLVLIYCPEQPEPVWLGYWEDNDWDDDPTTPDEPGQWMALSGYPVQGVTHWAELPEGPADE